MCPMLTDISFNSEPCPMPLPPAGSWTKFYEMGVDQDYLPGWMQAAGYDTYFVGKLLNRYTGR